MLLVLLHPIRQELLQLLAVGGGDNVGLAAGGKGAPLVPYLDYLWFREARIGRIVQNIGGIANLTSLPANCTIDWPPTEKSSICRDAVS